MESIDIINNVRVTKKYILFGLKDFAHSVEFLEKKTRIMQAQKRIILNFMLPDSKENLSLFITRGLIPFKPTMDFSISIALCIDNDLKNTQEMFTNKKVAAIAANLLIWILNFRKNLCKQIPHPCRTPHITNVQLAPCQIPPIKNVKNRLR